MHKRIRVFIKDSITNQLITDGPDSSLIVRLEPMNLFTSYNDPATAAAALNSATSSTRDAWEKLAYSFATKQDWDLNMTHPSHQSWRNVHRPLLGECSILKLEQLKEARILVLILFSTCSTQI